MIIKLTNYGVKREAVTLSGKTFPISKSRSEKIFDAWKKRNLTIKEKFENSVLTHEIEEWDLCWFCERIAPAVYCEGAPVPKPFNLIGYFCNDDCSANYADSRFGK